MKSADAVEIRTNGTSTTSVDPSPIVDALASSKYMQIALHIHGTWKRYNYSKKFHFINNVKASFTEYL